jgi:hypothetical protein
VERRLLQAAVAVAGLVPVSAGLAGALAGGGFLDLPPDAAAASHLRYLSGLLLGIGLAFWTTVPAIERARARFSLLTAIVVAGGLARLLGLALDGPAGGAMTFALVMELGVTPALWWWQGRLVRR